MSKLTLLEQFEMIKLGYLCSQGAVNEFALRENEQEMLNNIETALKKVETQEALAKEIEQSLSRPSKVINNHDGTVSFEGQDGILYVCDKEYRQKRAKAFEILKEKRVDVDLLLSSSLQDYNNFVSEEKIGEKQLTQEEYELLKEIFDELSGKIGG